MKKVLLHTCCAPCGSAVFEMLKGDSAVTSFFFNPNIAPESEYRRRRDELLRYCGAMGIPVIEGSFRPRDWVQRVKSFRFLGERSQRCWECYRFRLEETFRLASSQGFDAVATVLSISPHKDAAELNRIGSELEKEHGIEFIAADFKKNDGFKRSLELSRQHGFYRQDYCGCVYSRMERLKDRAWLEQAALRKKIP